MKKKLIPVLLAVLLLLTACAPGNSERGKEFGYFNYPGLEWGMTEEEFFEAIGKEAAAFEFAEVLGARTYTLRNGTFLNKKADVCFWFLTELDGAGETKPILFRINGIFLEAFDAEAFSASAKALADQQEVEISIEEKIRYTDQDNTADTVDPDVFETLKKENAVTANVICTANSIATGAALPEDYLKRARENYVRSQEGNLTEEQAVKQFDSIYAEGCLSSLFFSKEMIPDEGNPTFTLSGLITQIDVYAALAE